MQTVKVFGKLMGKLAASSTKTATNYPVGNAPKPQSTGGGARQTANYPQSGPPSIPSPAGPLHFPIEAPIQLQMPIEAPPRFPPRRGNMIGTPDGYAPIPQAPTNQQIPTASPPARNGTIRTLPNTNGVNVSPPQAPTVPTPTPPDRFIRNPLNNA